MQPGPGKGTGDVGLPTKRTFFSQHHHVWQYLVYVMHQVIFPSKTFKCHINIFPVYIEFLNKPLNIGANYFKTLFFIFFPETVLTKL